MKKYILYSVLMLAMMFSNEVANATDFSNSYAPYAANPIDEGVKVGANIKIVYAQQKCLPISVVSIEGFSRQELKTKLSPWERELVKDYEAVNISLLRYEWEGFIFLVTDSEKRIIVSIRVNPKEPLLYQSQRQ